MNITTILLYTHSGIRWLIVIAAILALGVFGYGWLSKKTFPKLARILPASYSGLLDTQALLGLIFMVWTGLAGVGFPRFRIEHMTMMILAAVVAHLPSRWRKAEKETFYREFRNSCVFGPFCQNIGDLLGEQRNLSMQMV